MPYSSSEVKYQFMVRRAGFEPALYGPSDRRLLPVGLPTLGAGTGNCTQHHFITKEVSLPKSYRLDYPIERLWLVNQVFRYTIGATPCSWASTTLVYRTIIPNFAIQPVVFTIQKTAPGSMWPTVFMVLQEGFEPSLSST